MNVNEYLAFIGRTINQVNDGKVGIFTPKGKETGRAANATDLRLDLINSLESEIGGLFPKLSKVEVKDVTRQAYSLKYIEPDSGLLNYQAFLADFNKALASEKPGSVFFFDGDKFSAWRKSYGQVFGNKCIETILHERIFKAGREVFAKHGITFYRHGSRSEEFYLLGRVDMKNLNKAVNEFNQALNQQFIVEIPLKELSRMSQSGKELMESYIREHPKAVKDGKATVDLTQIGRGKNAKYSGISLTGAGAEIKNEETLKEVVKYAEVLKQKSLMQKKGVKATLFYLDQGAPGGTLACKTGAVIYSATRGGLIGFFAEAPFSILNQLRQGEVTLGQTLSDMKDSGLGWAKFGLMKGAGQSFLNFNPSAATNLAIILPTLWQLEATPSGQRGPVLSGGITGLGGFVGGAKLANLIPGPAWLKGTMNILGGIGGSKISNELFTFLYKNSETFGSVINSKVMNGLGTVGAALDKPVTGYYGGKLAVNLSGYALRDIGLKKIGEKLLYFSKIGGVVTLTLSMPGMPFNATSLGAGSFKQSVQDLANGKPLEGGDESISSMKIYSDEFARIFGNTSANHAPRLALETASLLKELGCLKKPAQVSDKEWKKLDQAIGTGTLEQYLGGFFPGAERDAFIFTLREGLIAFQKDLFDQGIKVKVGNFDAETCRLLILAYKFKVE
ncbi:MAG: hypothetical protein ABH860_01785 [bacterium]